MDNLLKFPTEEEMKDFTITEYIKFVQAKVNKEYTPPKESAYKTTMASMLMVGYSFGVRKMTDTLEMEPALAALKRDEIKLEVFRCMDELFATILAEVEND